MRKLCVWEVTGHDKGSSTSTVCPFHPSRNPTRLPRQEPALSVCFGPPVRCIYGIQSETSDGLNGHQGIGASWGVFRAHTRAGNVEYTCVEHDDQAKKAWSLTEMRRGPLG